MNRQANQPISRRDFLKLAASAAAGAALAGCLDAASQPTMIVNTPTSPAENFQVAIARAASYSRRLVKEQAQTMLEAIGGIADLIRPGARVGIKPNLTGGTFNAPAGADATETYVTHPEVVRAVCELLLDAGAGKLYFVEGIWDRASWEVWGLQAVARQVNADLVDLNNPPPYASFANVPVGDDFYIYPSFKFNHILQELDIFLSIAKMKCHALCGVTHSMKNLVGITPIQLYQLPDSWGGRSALHGADPETRTRLPRVVVDLNRARPIDLAIVDGIQTVEGGEGPWQPTMRAVAPGLLFAGKNAVAVDAVATAAMGFDPTADYPNAPFLHGDNHLNLAREKHLGTNRLEEIQVLGNNLEDVIFPFKPV